MGKLFGRENPPSANPTQIAQQQQEMNLQSAQAQAALNNATTVSPWGVTSWTPTRDAQGNVTYTLNQQLSPAMQQLFGQQTGLASQLGWGASNQLAPGAFGLTGLGQQLFGNMANAAAGIPTNINAQLAQLPGIATLTPGQFRTDVGQRPQQYGVSSNFPQLVQQAQDAAYKAQTQYLDPQWRQSETNYRQRLLDQGIPEMDPRTGAPNEAFQRAMLDFNNSKQQAYSDARMQAVAAGNEQQRALFGQSVEAGQFVNQAQQQNFNQGLSLADLYNQALTSATGQQNIAGQMALQRLQTGANYPLQALSAMTDAARATYGSGVTGVSAAQPMVNLAPTWPLSIPTYGGYNTPVGQTNVPAAYQAATGANQLAMAGAQNTVSSLGGKLSMMMGK
jgi:hypothetical protein